MRQSPAVEALELEAKDLLGGRAAPPGSRVVGVAFSIPYRIEIVLASRIRIASVCAPSLKHAIAQTKHKPLANVKRLRKIQPYTVGVARKPKRHRETERE
jgi:hypothetical protein